MKARILIGLWIIAVTAPATAGFGDWMSYEAIDGEFVVAAKIEGHDTRAGLATDSLRHAVNETFLRRNGIPFHKTSTFDITFMNTHMQISRPAYYEDDSDIGMRLQPMFRSGVATQIDFAGHRIRFLPTEATGLRNSGNLRIRGGSVNSVNPAAAVVVDGQDYFFAMAEPRASFTTVSRKLAKQRGWLDKYRVDAGLLGAQAAGLEDYDIMQVPDLVLGPFEFEFAIVLAYRAGDYEDKIVTDLDNTASNTRFYDGVLGLDILNNFVLTLDTDSRKGHIYAP